MSELSNTLPWWLSKTQRRECYEGTSQLHAAIPIIGRFHLLKAACGGLLADAHPNEFELHLIEEGVQEIWIDTPDNQYSVVGGSAILTRPGQIHGGVRQILTPGSWSMIRFNLDLLDPASPDLQPCQAPSGTTVRSEAHIYAELLQKAKTPVFGYSAALASCFKLLLEEHRNRSATSSEMVRILLKELILRVSREHETQTMKRRLSHGDYSPPIRNGLDWLESNLCQPIRVEDAAIAGGLSESYFRRWFQREVGFSPADYVMHRRIELSKKLLLNRSRSITRIALELGFSTSAYFTAVFRKRTGLTPSQYREQTCRVAV